MFRSWFFVYIKTTVPSIYVDYISVATIEFTNKPYIIQVQRQWYIL